MLAILCAVVQLQPQPRPEEAGTGLQHDTEVQVCDGGNCKTAMTVKKGRWLRDAGGRSRDCATSAVVEAGGEPDDVTLTLIDLAHATAKPVADFHGDSSWGSSAWMGNRYVYMVYGGPHVTVDVYAATGKRELRATPNRASRSPDGRYVLGYWGEGHDGDKRVTLLAIDTLETKVLDAHPEQVRDAEPDWQAGKVVVGKTTYAIPSR